VCCFVPGDQGGTYCGNALMCAVALAVLDAVAAPEFLPTVRARSEQLRAGLNAIGRRVGTAPVQGRGLLLALVLPGEDAATQLAARGLARASASKPGLLVNAVRSNRLRFVPALNVEASDINLALALLEASMD
jgi:acetylornithine/N-succinyldiaminopimelate aminotransferase